MFADKVLFLNENEPVDLLQFSVLNKNKFKVVGPIGLNLNDYPHSKVVPSESIKFIFVARLLAEKGVFEYIDAARKVKAIYPSAEFTMLGGLDYDNPTALSSKELALVVEEGVVSCLGHVSNVYEFLVKSDVFVLPSYREGYPRSTQEAMSVGRAIITTDVPGCRDCVIDELNGFIVQPWDSMALAEKMIYFIENPKEITRMGENSRKKAINEFDVHKINPVLSGIVLGEVR
ncbi:MAG: glycosyltransferase family 4 protein [Candidatus Endonucleobacter sp. (ex Gigantidas childressi)]|nr:glycosyltransferase family 4 protein [Candidatus Endonucleobacter sp. (ex Gigantidas childressi)]